MHTQQHLVSYLGSFFVAQLHILNNLRFHAIIFVNSFVEFLNDYSINYQSIVMVQNNVRSRNFEKKVDVSFITPL